MANCQTRDDNKYLGIYVQRARTSGQDLGALANHFVYRRTWRTATNLETEPEGRILNYISVRQSCDSECYLLAKYQVMTLGLRIQHMNRPVLSGGFKLPTRDILVMVNTV